MDSQVYAVKSRDNLYIILILIIFNVLTAFCNRYFLFNDELYYGSLSGQLSDGQIANLLTFIKDWEWMGYMILPVLLIIKFLLVTVCLAVGYYFITSVWNFRLFLKATLFAEFIFILSAIVKLYWFGWAHTSYSLNELQNFSPLSLSSLITLDEADGWLRYPFQVISLFELAYCTILVIGIRQLLQTSWGQAARLVVFSYMPALIVWMVVVMFLSISTT